MKFTGKITDMSLDFQTGKPKITFLVNERYAIEQIEELKDLDKLNIEAKKYYSKRSLDANAYAWVLIGKMAEKLNMKNIDVYRKEIRDVGIYEVIPIKNEAVDRFLYTWQRNGLGWVCDTFESKLKGYTNVVAYYGSSVYDNKEMSRLIDNIVQDCKGLGIETLTPTELQVLKEEWK